MKKLNSLATALRKKMSAPLTKAIRFFPKKHEDYKMKKSEEEYAFLKDYNAREQSGGAVQNSDKDRAIVKSMQERK